MKAYNEQWILNREMVRQATVWHRQRLLSDEQMSTVRQAYPVGFRQTNGFIEIGLFLFTIVVILGVYLLLNSFLSSLLDNQFVYGIINIAFGGAVGLVGRLLTRQRLLYRNGVDNAFVVTLAGFLTFGINQFLPDGLSLSVHCLVTLPLLLVILWYYGDTLIAFLTLATLYALVFDSTLKYSWGKDALPFVMMGVSAVLYRLCYAALIVGSSRPKTMVYYADTINLTQWIALIVLAASGNYFVVREVNGLLLKPSPADAPEISLAWLFWGLTLLIPAVYLWQGVIRKNRTLIILGGLGAIGAVITVHEYAALVPLNVMLTLGGLALIGLAVLGIRYLRQARHGFTDAPDEESPGELLVNAETLATSQTAGQMPHGLKEDSRFGGGNFGGGGSEGNY
jgi:hypothetical protein